MWFALATVIAPVAVNTPVPTAALVATVVCLLAVSPAAFVTVRVYIVLANRTPVGTPTPLVTAPMLLSMLPVPPVNTAVSWVRVPRAMVGIRALKLAMLGKGTTVTVTVCETEAPDASLIVNL